MTADYPFEPRNVGTDFVREGYIHSGDLNPDAYRIMAVEFDRWLAEHDRNAAGKRLTNEEQQQIEAYQALASHPFFSFVHGRHGPFLDEMLEALSRADARGSEEDR